MLSAGTTFIQIPGLRPFTSYTFNVSAMTKAGTGPPATVSSKTPEGRKMLIIVLWYLVAVVGTLNGVQILQKGTIIYS